LIAAHKAIGQSYSGFITQVINFWIDVQLNREVKVKLDR
jgi:hypothetical protein